MNKELRTVYFGDRHVKRPKYRNRSCTCWSKHIHQSILEADHCSFLKGTQEIYDIQHKIEIFVNGKHITNHFVDFVIWKDKARTKILKFQETKGYFTDLWSVKKKLVEALYPDIPYEVLTEKKKLWRAG